MTSDRWNRRALSSLLILCLAASAAHAVLGEADRSSAKIDQTVKTAFHADSAADSIRSLDTIIDLVGGGPLDDAEHSSRLAPLFAALREEAPGFLQRDHPMSTEDMVRTKMSGSANASGEQLGRIAELRRFELLDHPAVSARLDLPDALRTRFDASRRLYREQLVAAEEAANAALVEPASAWEKRTETAAESAVVEPQAAQGPARSGLKRSAEEAPGAAHTVPLAPQSAEGQGSLSTANSLLSLIRLMTAVSVAALVLIAGGTWLHHTHSPMSSESQRILDARMAIPDNEWRKMSDEQRLQVLQKALLNKP